MLTCKEYTELKKKELKKYIEDNGLKPCLVVIQVGDRPESNSYIRGKMRDCEEVGIECKIHKYSDTVDQKLLEGVIKAINMNDDVHGIILQLPVPEHIDVKRLQKLIYPSKDVDGFNKLSNFDPCTPKGIIDYLKYNNYEFEGKDALVIGRSDIVGKPLARMLTDLDCTVTLAHSKTVGVYSKGQDADIIFTCTNKIQHLPSSLVYNCPDVIDIGLGVGADGKLHGNLEDHTVRFMREVFPDNICISGTGGVGLLTRLALLENMVKAAEMQRGE